MSGEKEADMLFVQLRGNIIGPLTEVEVKALLQTGSADNTTFVSSDKYTWRQIKDTQLAVEIEEPSQPAEPKPSQSSKIQPEQWFVQSHDGTRYGPITYPELKQWVTEGRLTATCLVWSDTLGVWKTGMDLFGSRLKAVSRSEAGPLPPAVVSTPRNERPSDHRKTASAHGIRGQGWHRKEATPEAIVLTVFGIGLGLVAVAVLVLILPSVFKIVPPAAFFGIFVLCRALYRQSQK
jgi:hypothetical protein